MTPSLAAPQGLYGPLLRQADDQLAGGVAVTPATGPMGQASLPHRVERVATNKDPEERVVTHAYVDDEEYHEDRECARLNRSLSSDTSLGVCLPRFRCTYCWQPRGVAEERRRLDMMAAERDRQEYEEAEVGKW
jgi:hypothetical protein